MLTLLTATGSRPEAWALCQKWMQRQSYAAPVRWIIVDDGEAAQAIKFKKRGWTLEVIRPEQHWQPGQNTQARNLLAGLALVGADDRLVIIEDDDWYAPDWLQTVNAALDRAELVGERVARYYNVRQSKFREFPNDNHASLCATAMRGQAINTFRSVCRPGINFIDMVLWNAHADRQVFDGSRVIGIKGLPGRSGIGIGHSREFVGDIDHGGEVLESWVGSDAAVYRNKGAE